MMHTPSFTKKRYFIFDWHHKEIFDHSRLIDKILLECGTLDRYKTPLQLCRDCCQNTILGTVVYYK